MGYPTDQDFEKAHERPAPPSYEAPNKREKPWGHYTRQYRGAPPAQLTLDAITAETIRARLKFPGNRKLYTALAEEVGELARALLQGKDRDQIEREAIQVAAMAIRLIEEGDPVYADMTDEEKQP